MKSVILFLIYFGKLPNYFHVWLNAVKHNSSIHFCIISDCVEQKADFPDNVEVIHLSFDAFTKIVQSKFDFKVSINNLGRISQFRPALAYIFPELVKGYEYWGYIECDLIPGDIRTFLTDELLEKYDKFFKLGHFQIFKNNEKNKNLFMHRTPKALNYRFAFQNNILYFEEILGMHNIAKAAGVKTFEDNIFADIKAYEYMFCRSTYGYDDSVEQKCICSYEDGHIYCYSVKDDAICKKEVLYVHLQKRNMGIETNDMNYYLMIPNNFSEFEDVSIELFNDVLAKSKDMEYAYRKEMTLKLDNARKSHYQELCWWKLKIIRIFIKLFGGQDLDGK